MSKKEAGDLDLENNFTYHYLNKVLWQILKDEL
jgi:hypothetical protein